MGSFGRERYIPGHKIPDLPLETDGGVVRCIVAKLPDFYFAIVARHMSIKRKRRIGGMHGLTEIRVSLRDSKKVKA